MPQDDIKSSAASSKSQPPKSTSDEGSDSWFSTPRPIRRIFDRFPLRTYASNGLPQRIARSRAQHALYVFTTDDDSKTGLPSFNPGCLKWQTYLKFMGEQFVTISSNNHASPSGALPFLLPAASTATSLVEPIQPVPSNKLQQWICEGKGKPQMEPLGPALIIRYKAYMSLLDNKIRNAWLYALYLEPANFKSVAKHLYIYPSSSNLFVRLSLAYSLRKAAEVELLKHTAVIDVETLYEECDNAFSALSELLGDDEYFFSEEQPGLFDASVFAYTHLLLDEEIEWQEKRMVQQLQEHANLIRHRGRIFKDYYPRRIS